MKKRVVFWEVASESGSGGSLIREQIMKRTFEMPA